MIFHGATFSMQMPASALIMVSVGFEHCCDKQIICFERQSPFQKCYKIFNFICAYPGSCMHQLKLLNQSNNLKESNGMKL